MDEQQPLREAERSTDAEGLLDGRSRRGSNLWQSLAMVAAAALLVTAAFATVSDGGKGGASSGISSSSVAASSVFLAETAADAKGQKARVDDAPAKEKAAKALQDAQSELDKAKGFKQHSDELEEGAKDLKSKSAAIEEEVQQQQDAASKHRSEAEKTKNDAQTARQQAIDSLKEAREKAKAVNEEAKKKAAKLLEEAGQKAKELSDEATSKATDLDQKAKGLDTQAVGLDRKAAREDGIVEQKEKKAKEISTKEGTMESQAKDEEKKATDAEQKALKETGASRLCIGLPGVKLRGNSPATFDAVVGEHTVEDDWQCNEWCLKHAECKQSVFTWETKKCELFKEATSEPLYFRERWPWYNSSYCDTADKKQDMLDMLHEVYEAKPWVPPPHNCSWGAENCLATGCCADVCDASWDFATCKYYTCFKKDENFAGCRTGGPPAGWDGTELGGHPNTEVAPAEKGKLIQGSRLYCFSVVMWNAPPGAGWMDSEGTIANHWKEQGKGIMQCDDYNLFDGQEGGSVHNIQSFIHAWQLVKEDGRWKQNDWSIKVDPDAVFFPEHFRKKLEWVWRTPQGAAIYMRNTFYKFQFLGALEALTREAVEILFDRSWECEAKLGQQGGEDYWLLQCLEGLGMDYQTDVTLLHDKYASDENCGDPNGVAHHFFKKIDSGDGWDNCWNTANDAWNNEHPEIV